MEVRSISNLLVDQGGLLPVRAMECQLFMSPALMAMNRATPSTRLQVSGEEAPKTASLSLTVHVLRVQHYCAFRVY